jgi:hypothetical protein
LFCLVAHLDERFDAGSAPARFLLNRSLGIHQALAEERCIPRPAVAVMRITGRQSAGQASGVAEGKPVFDKTAALR